MARGSRSSTLKDCLLASLTPLESIDLPLEALMPESHAARRELLSHPIYRRVASANDARLFMSHHVFAVWDFMSLLKALQRRLTCVDVPWLPPDDTEAVRLINEIVLAEESDEDPAGGYVGHYDLYLEAMRDVGADARAISRFIAALQGGAALEDALVFSRAPGPVRAFVRTTIDIAKNGAPHEIAAAFFLGRENVIPEMFAQLIASLERIRAEIVDRLRYYLSRHVALDGGHHGPAAERLLRSLCGDDQERWKEADLAAARALRARIHLWSSVLEALDAIPVLTRRRGAEPR